MDPDYLSLEELERLSRAYLDCRLSKLQEKELELVFLSSDISSPVIDEARETMGLTAVLGSMVPVKRHIRFRFLWHRWIAVAACIAVMAVVAIRFDAPLASGDSYASEVTVYVDGRRLEKDKARQIAAGTQEMCMAMLEKTVGNAHALQQESVRMLDN